MKIQSTLTIALACVLPYSALNAQTYIPTIVEGNQWEVRMPLGLGTYSSYTYTLRCDTLINDLLYLIAKDADDNVLAFYRENIETQEVFILEVDSTEERLILSYNWQEGDTIQFLNYELIVDSVYYAPIYGMERKVLWLNGLTKFIEGIGSSWQGIYIHPAFIMDPFRFFHVYDFIATQYSCEPNSYVRGIDAEEKLLVWPNPFHDRLYISMPQGAEMCTIYHISGKVMNSIFAGDTMMIDTESYPPGMYVIRTANGYVIKVVKK